VLDAFGLARREHPGRIAPRPPRLSGSFLLGVSVLGPTAKRIEAVVPETEAGQRLIRRIFALPRVDLPFLFAIVFAMVVEPTGTTS
jgi:hypothetical protein